MGSHRSNHTPGCLLYRYRPAGTVILIVTTIFHALQHESIFNLFDVVDRAAATFNAGSYLLVLDINPQKGRGVDIFGQNLFTPSAVNAFKYIQRSAQYGFRRVDRKRVTGDQTQTKSESTR